MILNELFQEFKFELLLKNNCK